MLDAVRESDHRFNINENTVVRRKKHHDVIVKRRMDTSISRRILQKNSRSLSRLPANCWALTKYFQGAESLFRRQQFTQLVKNSPAFYGA
jgi:hypothetical protein